MLNDVTLLIKTFERPDSLRTLLDSIKERELDCPVIIADDSHHPYRDAILQEYGDLVTDYIVLPYDSGVSAGRNALLDRVQTRYFVLNDDDFAYDARTDLKWMREQLETTDLELLGGVIYEPIRVHFPSPWSAPRAFVRATSRWLKTLYKKTVHNEHESTYRFHGTIQVENGTISLKRIPCTEPVTRCDYCLNFFMADTEAVRQKVGGWYDPLKVMEHWEFFYRAKLNDLRVGTTERVGAKHLPRRTTEYAKHRLSRESDYRRLGLERHGLQRLVIHGFVATDLHDEEAESTTALEA